jgi:adenosylcobinamide-GDP ribazoletransferase
MTLVLLWWQGAMALLVSSGVWWWLRRAMLQRVQGFTGDLAGALVELLECTVVLVIALSGPHI